MWGNEAAWMAFLLFREKAAVPVAVHEDKYGRNVVPSRLLQILKVISTAEYPLPGKRPSFVVRCPLPCEKCFDLLL